MSAPFDGWADCPHLGGVRINDDGELRCHMCGERLVYRGAGAQAEDDS